MKNPQTFVSTLSSARKWAACFVTTSKIIGSFRRGSAYLAVAVLLTLMSTESLVAQCCGAQPSTFRQPNGTVIEVHFHGNELYTRTVSADGYTLFFDPEQKCYFYAVLSKKGDAFLSSGILAEKVKPADLDIPKHLKLTGEARRKLALKRRAELEAVRKDRERWAAQKKKMADLRAWQRANPKAGKLGVQPVVPDANQSSGTGEESQQSSEPAQAPPNNPPTLGDLVGLTILVDFPDVQARSDVTRSDIDDYLNKPGGKWSNNASVHEYFKIQSSGRLNYNNNVTYYVRMPQPYSYYNDVSLSSGTCGRRLLQDAINILLAEGYDFSGLSVDPANGRVIATNLMWAGNDSGSWAKGLWPHRWVIGPVSVGNGMYIYDYQCTDIGTSGYPTIGTFCHENGHLVGKYPDYYDTDGGEGVGNHCLMGAGNHATQTNPTNISSYLKYHSGWMDAVELTSLTGPIRLAASVDNTIVYKYTNTDPGWTDEYFLVENRSKSGGWEAASGLPDSGLMISHIHEAGGNSTSGPEDEMTEANHYEHSVEQADGLYQLEGQGTWGSSKNRGNNTDYFHSGGTGPKTEFSDATTPPAKWWKGATTTAGTGTNSGLHIHSVSNAGAVMTFVYGAGTPAGPATTSLTRTYLEANTDYGANAESQSFYVYNSGSGTVTYSVTDDVGWLDCNYSVNTASTTANLVTVNYTTAGLASGTHTATITVDGGSAGTKTIAVTLTVNATPVLSVSPSSISVAGIEGVAGPNSSFTITNIGEGTADYSVSSVESWLNFTPSSGTVGLERDSISIEFDATGLTPGVYTDTITINSTSATNAPLNISVTFTVDHADFYLTTPNGGESWTSSTIRNITWYSTLGGNVKIELLKSDVKLYDIISSTPNDGSYDWFIPVDQTVGADYSVRITSVEDGGVTDVSYQPFSIAAPTPNIFVSDLEVNPGFTTTGLFEWGSPGGNNRASSAYSGTRMYDTDLDNTCWTESTLTTLPLDCSKHSDVQLNFWIHQYVYLDYEVRVEVSNDGANWTELYSTGTAGSTSSQWIRLPGNNTSYDISVVADGKPTVYVRWSMLGSGSQYGGGGIAIDDISITGTFVPDSPPHGVTLLETAGSTVVTEGGANDTYSIVLDSQPTDTVTITLTDDADVNVTPSSVQFSTSDWDQPKSITVSAENDSLHELLHSGTITHAATSPDGNYNGIFVADLVVTVIDDDNNAPFVDAGIDQTVVLDQVGGAPVAGAYYEWDAAADSAGDNAWNSTTANTYDWVFAAGLSPADVNDARFGSVTKAYSFPAAQDASNTSWDAHGSNEPATFEFVIDVDGTDGSIFETGGSGDGLQVDVVGGVLRGTCQETTPARVQYALTAEDLGRFIHVVFVADSANDVVQLYIDGVLKDTQAWTGPDWAGTDSASLGEQAGSMPTNGSTAAFVGKMALFRYYRNKAFTATDVQTNYDSIAGSAASVDLMGYVRDLDDDALDTEWTVLGTPPGNVQFGTSTDSFAQGATNVSAPGLAVNSTATFDAEGVYTLQLTATDGVTVSSDTCVITVSPPSAYNVIVAESDGSTAVSEDGATDTYTIVLGAEPTNQVTVNISGGAQLDVTSTSEIFDSSNWDQVRTITVSAIDDDDLEGNHTGTITHTVDTTDPDYSGVEANSIVASIADNDDPGTLTLASVSESVGESDGTIVLTVSRAGGSKGLASVSYTTTDGTAAAGSDFTGKTGTLNWGDGDVTDKTITIDITSDLEPENDKDFTVTISDAIGAFLGSPATTTVTILDDDDAGTVSLTAADYGVSEGAGSIVLSVDRLSGTAGTVSVSYATSDGEALNGSDYTDTSGTLTWGPGDGSVKTITIPILNDTVSEVLETFSVTLSLESAFGALGDYPSATILIDDDDFSPDTITGLVGWYDAQELSTAVNGGVTSWSDKTGGTNSSADNLAQYTGIGGSTAVAPTRQDIVLNGHTYKSVRFVSNPAKHYELLYANGLVTTGDTSRTVVTVYKGGNDDVESRPVSFGSALASDNANSVVFWGMATDGNGSLQFGKSNGNNRLINSQTAGLNRTDFLIRTSVMNTATSYDEYIDVLDSNFADTQVLDNASPGVTTNPRPNFYVGDVMTGAVGPTFDILEILVFDAVLADSDRTQLQDYLKLKYTNADVDHFVISSIDPSQSVGTPIAGITITAKDASNNTVSSFNGTVNFGGSAGIGGTSGSFVNGVLTGVSVTPTVAGTSLTFTVSDVLGATGSATFNVSEASDPYDVWSGGADFNLDGNGDGVTNGLAWVFGASDVNVNAVNLSPVIDNSSDPTYMIFNFRRLDAAHGDANTSISVDYGSTLAAGDWQSLAINGGNVGADGVDDIVVREHDNDYVDAGGGDGVDRIEVKFKRSTHGASGKMFSRLKVERSIP